MQPTAATQEPPARAFPVGRAVAATLLLAALAFLYRAPALFVWDAWQADPYYAHGVAVFVVAAGLAAWRLWKAPAAPAALPAWSLLGIPAALGLYLAGFLRADAYVLAWSGLALAAAVALATGGAARVRLVAAPLVLAALTLPTPWTLELGVALQDAATRAAAWSLGLVGIPVERGLTSLASGPLVFDVTPACSGLTSAVSLLALAALVGTVFPARRVLVGALAIPLALLLNVLRIDAVILVGLRWGADAAEGFFHGASSGLIFLVETVLLLALAGALRRPRKEAPA